MKYIFSLEKFSEDCRKDGDSEELIKERAEGWAGDLDGQEVRKGSMEYEPEWCTEQEDRL